MNKLGSTVGFGITMTALGVLLTLGIQQVAPKAVLTAPPAPPPPPTEEASDKPSEKPGATKYASDAEADDPLVAVNQAFRAHYKKARSESIRLAEPIFIESGGTLVLIHKGKRQEKAYLPERYHRLKSIGHITLALYVMHAHHTDEKLSDEHLAELDKFRALVVKAEASLAGRGYSAELLEVQKKVMAEALAFIDQARKNQRVSRDELVGFTRKVRPMVMQVAAEAAATQLDALHQQVSVWRKEIGAEDWKKVHAVMIGSPMPRKGALATQYFAKLLGEKDEAPPKLIYAESLWEEARAVSSLGTYLLDESISIAYFDDPVRMYRDLLEDVARAHLEKMKIDQ